MIEVLVVDDDVRVARINAAYVAKVPGFRVARWPTRRPRLSPGSTTFPSI